MKAAPTFEILFAILNTLQGFLIFIFFCVLKKEIRSSWAPILKNCGFCQDKKNALHSMRQSTKLSLVTRPSVISNMGKDEAIFTEEMKTLGPTAQLTHTLSLHKSHTEEMVKVAIYE